MLYQYLLNKKHGNNFCYHIPTINDNTKYYVIYLQIFCYHENNNNDYIKHLK